MAGAEAYSSQLVPYGPGRSPWREKIGLDLWVTHTPPSLAVAFRRPNAYILSRHTLFTSTVNVGGGSRHFAQVYTVPHLTRERVDSLIKQLEMSGAFDPNEH